MKLKEICEKGTSNIAQKDIIDRNGIYPIYGASGFIKNIDSFAMDTPYIGIVKDGAGVGRVMLLPAKSSVIGTMQYIIPKNGINASYLVYLLESMNLSKYSTGATIPHIYFKDYGNKQVKERTETEQQRIANELDNVSELIDKRQTQLQKLDLLIKSKFVEMFGDTIFNSNKYPVEYLCNLGQWTSGGTPSRSNPDYFKGYINWFTAGELNKLYLTNSIEKITLQAIEESAAKLFRKGSLLLGMYDTAAFKMGILLEDSSANQACACLEANEKVSIIWLYFNLSYMKNYFLQQRRGVRQKNLNLSMIKNFAIPLPPIELQNQFADFVDKVEQSKTKIKASLDKLTTLKKALMQKYFG